MAVAWNESYVISGMYAGGKNIWRITPDTTKVSKKDFLVQNGDDVVFFIDGIGCGKPCRQNHIIKLETVNQFRL